MEMMDGVLYDDNASHGNDIIYVDMSDKSAKKQGQWIQVLSISALHRINDESTAYVHSVCLAQETIMRDPDADQQMKADAVTVYNRYAGLLAKFHEWWALMVQLYSNNSKQHQKESLVIQHHILYRYINWTLRYWTKFGRFVCELNPSLVALCKGEACMTNPCKDYPTPERQWRDDAGLFQVKQMGLPTRRLMIVRAAGNGGGGQGKTPDHKMPWKTMTKSWQDEFAKQKRCVDCGQIGHAAKAQACLCKGAPASWTAEAKRMFAATTTVLQSLHDSRSRVLKQRGRPCNQSHPSKRRPGAQPDGSWRRGQGQGK